MAKKQDIKLVAPEEVATTEEVVTTEEVATTEVATTEAATTEAATTGELGSEGEGAPQPPVGELDSESEESEESNLDIAEQMVSATKEFYMGIFGELTATMFEPLEQVIKEARFKAGEIDGTEDKIQKEDLDDLVQSNLDLANEALARLNGEL